MNLLVIGEVGLPFIGKELIPVANITKALDFLCSDFRDVSLVLMSVDHDCAGFIRCLELENIALPVIAYGKHFDSSKAEKAIRAGALDYFSLDSYQDVVLELLWQHDSRIVEGTEAFISRIMVNFVESVGSAKFSRNNIVIRGPKGIGKSFLVHHVAEKYWGDRKVIQCDCANVPKEMLASTLFGHAAGSRAGSLRTKIGKIERASGGGILLLKNAELVPEQIMREVREVFYNGKLYKLGESEPVNIDASVVFTHRSKADILQEGLLFDFPSMFARNEDKVCLFQSYCKFFEELYGVCSSGVSYLLELVAASDWADDVGGLISFARTAVLRPEYAKQALSGAMAPGFACFGGLGQAIEVMKYKVSCYRKHHNIIAAGGSG